MEEVEYEVKVSCGCLYHYFWQSSETHYLSFEPHIDGTVVRQKQQSISYRGNGQEKPLVEIELLFAINHHISMRQIMGLEGTAMPGRMEEK